tara:strand:- start:359 stop:694 length:336 start_codon:yes stop_codon:yes gene_type:complete
MTPKAPGTAESESDYFSSLNNSILIFTITVAFYELFKKNPLINHNFIWGILIICLFIIYNLLLCFSLEQFWKRSDLNKKYKTILFIKGIILFIVQIIISIFIFFDIRTTML